MKIYVRVIRAIHWVLPLLITAWLGTKFKTKCKFIRTEEKCYETCVNNWWPCSNARSGLIFFDVVESNLYRSPSPVYTVYRVKDVLNTRILNVPKHFSSIALKVVIVENTVLYVSMLQWNVLECLFDWAFNCIPLKLISTCRSIVYYSRLAVCEFYILCFSYFKELCSQYFRVLILNTHRPECCPLIIENRLYTRTFILLFLSITSLTWHLGSKVVSISLFDFFWYWSAFEWRMQFESWHKNRSQIMLEVKI